MSEEVEFLPYVEALKIVGNVIEEEHIREPDKRILTVYNKDGKELCWFDADEVIAESKPDTKIQDEIKKAAVEYVMHRIPVWVLD
jgi:hypothetical protein